MLMKYAMQLAALRHTKPRQMLYPRRNCGESPATKEYVAIMPIGVRNQRSCFESINTATDGVPWHAQTELAMLEG